MFRAVDTTLSIIYGRRHPNVSETPHPSVRTLMTARRREVGSSCKINSVQYFFSVTASPKRLLLDKSLKNQRNLQMGKVDIWLKGYFRLN